jgi:hypothetical protein
VTLLGLMTPFDDRLGVDASVYDVGFAYDDSLAYRMIKSYATRVRHVDVELGTKEYDRTGLALLSDVAAVTPGDVVTRVLAAMREIPVFVLREYLSAPRWIRSHGLRRFYSVRERVDVRLALLAVTAIAVAVVVAAGRSIRYGLFLILMLGIFAGGAALQFQERHFFYLEFVPWWAFAWLARLVWISRHELMEWRLPVFVTRDRIMRAGAFAAACTAAVALIVGVTRTRQDRVLRALLDEYLAAPRHPLADQAMRGSPLVTTFAVADLGGQRCPVDSVDVTIDGAWHRTMEVRVDRRSAEPTHVVFAEYQWPRDGKPVSVTVPAEQEVCLSGVSRIDTSTFPVLLNATLAPGWRQARLHQRLTSLWK